MKSCEISESKIGPFSLACNDPYTGIGREKQSTALFAQVPFMGSQARRGSIRVQNKTYKFKLCVLTEDSDQPTHPQVGPCLPGECKAKT